VNGQYEDTVYTGAMKIVSTIVTGFALTANEIFEFGQVK
jgi:hypothetical protein